MSNTHDRQYPLGDAARSAVLLLAAGISQKPSDDLRASLQGRSRSLPADRYRTRVQDR